MTGASFCSGLRLQVGEPPSDLSFPAHLPLSLERSARSLRGGRILTGGDPPRALTLSRAGSDATRRFAAAGAGDVAAELTLARRLTDAGIMHPCPPEATYPESLATVVIPVLDRPEQLARCLAALCAGGVERTVIVTDDGSADAESVAMVCSRVGARLVRLAPTQGPAGARNAAAVLVDTPLIAFLDSDCVPGHDWIERLAGHFADPLVAAVAPRVVGLSHHSQGAVARFAAAHTSLDLGAHPARVAPGRRVSYLPTAALLVRRSAFANGFDPDLRYGEDVDLIWRLHDAGWRIRYDPSVVVRHDEPPSWSRLIERKFRYGTSAAPLAARHPGRLTPLILAPWSAGVMAAGLAGRPLTAVAIAGAQTAATIRRLDGAGVPVAEAARWPLRGAGQTLIATGKALTTLAPAALAAGLVCRRTRAASLVLLASPAIVEWKRRRPPLDVVRWTALAIADDIAYGAGVWTGSVRARSWSAVRPALTTRSRALVTRDGRRQPPSPH